MTVSPAALHLHCPCLCPSQLVLWLDQSVACTAALCQGVVSVRQLAERWSRLGEAPLFQLWHLTG